MKKWVRLIMSIVGLLALAIVVACYNVTTGAGVMTAVVIAGFTEEQSKAFSDFIEKQSTDIQSKVKSMVDNLKDTDLIKGIQALLNGEGEKKGIVGNLTEMQTQLDAISTDIAKAKKEGQKTDVELSLSDAIKELVTSEQFKADKKAGFKGTKAYTLKAGTSDITGTVNLTQQRYTVGFAPERALAFLPNTVTGTVGPDRDRVLWVEGTYASNVGYVGEGTGPATADTKTAVEKTRGMAKISAKLPLTAEELEDAEYLASKFRMKMQSQAMLYTDLQFYSGDGSDSPNPTHIYGIVGHATAFSAATAGVTNAVFQANIGDLIDACILQGQKSEQNGINVLWINPSDFYLMKKAKDGDGQYLFVKDVNGTYTINGLRVIPSSAVTANTLTVADTSKIQAWWKRNPEIKFSQMNGTDFIDDAYTAVMFLRCQCVVEAQDKTAIIHVADIAASLATISQI